MSKAKVVVVRVMLGGGKGHYATYACYVHDLTGGTMVFELFKKLTWEHEWDYRVACDNVDTDLYMNEHLEDRGILCCSAEFVSRR